MASDRKVFRTIETQGSHINLVNGSSCVHNTWKSVSSCYIACHITVRMRHWLPHYFTSCYNRVNVYVITGSCNVIARFGLYDQSTGRFNTDIVGINKLFAHVTRHLVYVCI